MPRNDYSNLAAEARTKKGGRPSLPVLADAIDAQAEELRLLHSVANALREENDRLHTALNDIEAVVRELKEAHPALADAKPKPGARKLRK